MATMDELSRAITAAVRKAMTEDPYLVESKKALLWAVNEMKVLKEAMDATLEANRKIEATLTGKYSTVMKCLDELRAAELEAQKTIAQNQRLLEKITEERIKKEKAVEILTLEEELQEQELREVKELEDYVAQTQQEIKQAWDDLEYNKQLRKKRIKQGFSEYHKPLADKLSKGERQTAEIVKQQEEFAKSKRAAVTQRTKKLKEETNAILENGNHDEALPDLDLGGEEK